MIYQALLEVLRKQKDKTGSRLVWASGAGERKPTVPLSYAHL